MSPVRLETRRPGPGRVPKPWGRPVSGDSFHPDYPTEFRQSLIPGAGKGWWALVDIPKGTPLRRVSVAEGTLLRVGSMAELEATGWDVDDSVNYGVGHRADPGGIYFVNPGTSMNHADKTRQPSIKYMHDKKEAFTLVTTKDVKAGEELLDEYHKDFAACPWFDEMQIKRGNIPLSQLNDHIDKLYAGSGT